MTTVDFAGTFRIGDRAVSRLGYGAMQLAGPGVFGPPKDVKAAIAVLREAIACGVNHIDTSDYYGPHITNQIISRALDPYPNELVIVTKVGAKRAIDGSWLPAFSQDDLVQAVHDNLRNLRLDVLQIVNFRSMLGNQQPQEGSLEGPMTVLAELQHKGLIRHIGMSNITSSQLEEGRRICRIVCVQNHYNLVQRSDEGMIDGLAREGIPYVPYFPLGGFTPLQSSILIGVAAATGATPMQVAIAWLLRRSPNILLIPGTASIGHLRENVGARALALSDDAINQLDGIVSSKSAAAVAAMNAAD